MERCLRALDPVYRTYLDKSCCLQRLRMCPNKISCYLFYSIRAAPVTGRMASLTATPPLRKATSWRVTQICLYLASLAFSIGTLIGYKSLNALFDNDIASCILNATAIVIGGFTRVRWRETMCKTLYRLHIHYSVRCISRQLGLSHCYDMLNSKLMLILY